MIIGCRGAGIIESLVDLVVVLPFSVYKLQTFSALKVFWVTVLALLHLFVEFDHGI